MFCPIDPVQSTEHSCCANFQTESPSFCILCFHFRVVGRCGVLDKFGPGSMSESTLHKDGAVSFGKLPLPLGPLGGRYVAFKKPKIEVVDAFGSLLVRSGGGIDI